MVNTSYMGRLVDGVAALAGGQSTITYEGQAAIEFEAMANPHKTESDRFVPKVLGPDSKQPTTTQLDDTLEIYFHGLSKS